MLNRCLNSESRREIRTSPRDVLGRVGGVCQRAQELHHRPALGEHLLGALHIQPGHCNSHEDDNDDHKDDHTEDGELHEHAELLLHADLTLVASAVASSGRTVNNFLRVFEFSGKSD